MNEEDLVKIKEEITNYPIEILISLWALTNDELDRRMKKQK